MPTESSELNRALTVSYHGLDRADPEWTILKALAGSVVLELLACLMAGLSFSSVLYILLTAVFSLVGKLAVSVLKSMIVQNGCSFMQPLFLSMLGPWLLLLPLISYDFVQQCEHKREESTFLTFFAWLHGTFGFEVPITVYSHYTIRCPKLNVVTLMPLTIEFGLPVVITYIVVKLSTVMWGFDLTDTYTRNGVRRLALDFADMAFFGTMAFHHSGLVFFQANPVWFRAYLVIFAVTFIATLFKSHHLAHRGGLETCIETLKCCSSCLGGMGGARLVELFSLVLNTLPLVLVRGYFKLVGVQASSVFLFKGLLCMIHEIGVITTGNENNCASTYIYRIVEMLPGTAELEKQTSIEVYHQTCGDLEQQKQQLKVAREEAEASKVEADAKHHLLELKARQCEILTKFQSIFFGETLPETEIREIFNYFDFDNNNKLTLTEYKKLINMLRLRSEQVEMAVRKFEDIDKNGNGFVDLNEFVQLMNRDWLGFTGSLTMGRRG